MTGKRQNAYFRKLLVGYDGSPQSEKAVDVAFSLAECLDATVLIFVVARPRNRRFRSNWKPYWTTRRNTLQTDSRSSWKGPAGATFR